MRSPINAVVREASKEFDGTFRARMETLKDLLEGYAKWDLFEFPQKPQPPDKVTPFAKLQRARERLDFLEKLLGQKAFRGLPACLDRNIKHLEEIAKCGTEFPSMVLAKDVFANGIRRMKEGRFDDAVARFYRTLEAFAQALLWERKQIRTAKVPLKELPREIRERKSALAPGAIEFELGLKDAYALMDHLGWEDGKRFLANSLLSGEQAVINARNSSILAHGFQPIFRDGCKLMHDAIRDLTKWDDASIPQFFEFSESS